MKGLTRPINPDSMDLCLSDRRAKREVKPISDDAGGHVPRGAYQGILVAVAGRYHISTASIVGPSQRKIFVEARREFCVLMHRTGQFSCADIGRIMGRHHSTVLHLLKTGKARLEALERAAMRQNCRDRKLELGMSFSPIPEGEIRYPDLSGEWAI